MKAIPKVSVHGGHSGQFCHHAQDSLEEMIRGYLGAGFSWVGITEHVAPRGDAWRYPDEIAAGLSATLLQRRFADYIRECRHWQQQLTGQLEILVAFETEAWSGYGDYIERLRDTYQPDYLVGSVHHVHDICIDYDDSTYLQAVAQSGSIDRLYCDYFDLQYELIQRLRPEVIGHFDLIRLKDPEDYRRRWDNPEIWQRIERNLQLIAEQNGILDYNLRALSKGQPEPYLSEPILLRAHQLGIAIVPGDDAHSVDQIGANWEKGISWLIQHHIPLKWRKPGPPGQHA